MPAPVSGNNWDKIRQGLKDAQQLNSQRKYNLSMIKCRQTLEFMVQDLCEKAMITPKDTAQDLSSLIEELYSNRWISKTTSEHYHKIRILGNKAVHDGNDNAYDANQACQLLSHEVVTFSRDYMNDARQQPRSGGGTQRASSGNGTQRASSGGQRMSSGSGAQRTSSGGGQSGRGSGTASRSRRRSADGFPLSSTDLMRIAIVVVAVILVIAVVRLVRGGSSSEEETSTEVSTSAYTEPETPPETMPTPPETMAETTPAPVYKTTANLNVRAEPSTSGAKLGLLEPGTVVEYLEDYDSEWAIIEYNGTQAYVSKQYLEHD